MNSGVQVLYNGTQAFSQHLGKSTGSGAMTMRADILARRDRHPTALSLVPRKSPTVNLQIGDNSVVLTIEDYGTGVPAWTDPVLRSLSERWGLSPGWDSYNAKPTKMEHVVQLLNHLSSFMNSNSLAPVITPLADGGVQAEWHIGQKDLEVVVPAGEPPTYYFYNAETQDEEGDVLDANYARVRDLISEL